MKKDAPFECNEHYQVAFDNDKAYVTTPPPLASPVKRKTLVLYITALEHSLGALLAKNVERMENALYYLCPALVGPQEIYSPVQESVLVRSPSKRFVITSSIITRS